MLTMFMCIVPYSLMRVVRGLDCGNTSMHVTSEHAARTLRRSRLYAKTVFSSSPSSPTHPSLARRSRPGRPPSPWPRSMLYFLLVVLILDLYSTKFKDLRALCYARRTMFSRSASRAYTFAGKARYNSNALLFLLVYAQNSIDGYISLSVRALTHMCLPCPRRRHVGRDNNKAHIPTAAHPLH